MANPSTGNFPRLNFYSVAAGLLVLVMAALIVFPMLRMIARAFMVDGAVNLQGPLSVLKEAWLPRVLINTGVVIGVSTLIALVVGSVMAWLNERTDANLGVLGLVLPVIPLLMPGIALSIGWAFIGAPRVGFLNGILAELPLVGASGVNLSVNIYSWAGLVWVYSLHGVPYVYLVVSSSLRNLDPSLEEASRISGAGLVRTLRRVSLPAIRPAVLASALLVIISGFALFSIPTIIATTAEIDILAVRIVRLLRNDFPPRMDQAVVLGLIMLMVIAAAWYAQRRVSASGHFVTLGGRATSASRMAMGRWRKPAQAMMIAYLACASLIPLLALTLVALQPYWTPSVEWSQLTFGNFKSVLIEERMTASAFRNSILLSVSGATIAMAIAAIAAIYVAQTKGWLSKAVDAIMKAPATISSLILSVGFLVTFSGAPFFLAGTLVLLLVAYVVIHIPPGSIAASAAATQVGADMREASYVAGAGEGRTVRRIVVPLMLPGLAAGWAMVFVHMMGDLSASALLAGLKNPVIGFAILEIWEMGSFGLLAAFSTVMCVVITLVVLLTLWLVGSRGRGGLAT
ncbi:MAG: iron ABC transporter permease [Betaproteobacteria bacterium]|nr:iron ABC transporter permease [Betaproteobacteria bacterium]